MLLDGCRLKIRGCGSLETYALVCTFCWAIIIYPLYLPPADHVDLTLYIHLSLFFYRFQIILGISLYLFVSVRSGFGIFLTRSQH